MSIVSLADHRERQRAAADRVFVVIELEVRAARDAIMARSLRRVAQADPAAMLEPTLERLGQVWRDAT